MLDVRNNTGLLFVRDVEGFASKTAKRKKIMRPGNNDGPFPKSVFPTSVFPRRIFPWMGGDDDEEDDADTSDGKRKQDDKDEEQQRNLLSK